MSEPVVELRLWRQFLAVAEELHFGRAALRLHITQPPLTQAIALLEERIGARLFERTKRSVKLTPAGAALIPEARELLARAAALPAHARAAAHGEIGRLRLAFVSTVGFGLLPQWVRAFRAQHPQVAFELIEATGDVQLPALERGDVDAGFIIHSPGFAPPQLQHLRIGREPLVAAIPEQHALARARALRLDALLAEPLVIFPRRIVPSLHDAVFGLYHARGRMPHVAQEAIQMQTIVNLVAAGLGIAWVPDSVREFRRAGVVYRAVQRVPECETSLVWAGARVPPALERFLAFARPQLKRAQ
ncbi:LysR family transcriptional regulator [Ramlibacter sp. PS4R-6]|uniref:LysR family transcriptional regulator n=1 Tax=Ramlibacter sp. PS4R-6 TaxID=3133438 RepID=UPI00309579E4